jgi:hypothetical protein
LFPVFFYPYYFPVLFSIVATFEIQRFKISVSCFSSTCRYSTVHVPCGISIQTSPASILFSLSASYNLIIFYELALLLVICPFPAILFSLSASYNLIIFYELALYWLSAPSPPFYFHNYIIYFNNYIFYKSLSPPPPIFPLFSLFNLLFLCIFNLFSQFSSAFSISFHYSTYLSSVFSMSFSLFNLGFFRIFNILSLFIVCLFVLFILAIVLPVFCLAVSDYHYGIFKLLL